MESRSTNCFNLFQYDIKQRRIFLRRSPIENIKMQDLYLGSTISVMSRQLSLVEYGDDYTRRKVGAQKERWEQPLINKTRIQMNERKTLSSETIHEIVALFSVMWCFHQRWMKHTRNIHLIHSFWLIKLHFQLRDCRFHGRMCLLSNYFIYFNKLLLVMLTYNFIKPF